jgi:hypothetical protein
MEVIWKGTQTRKGPSQTRLPLQRASGSDFRFVHSGSEHDGNASTNSGCGIFTSAQQLQVRESDHLLAHFGKLRILPMADVDVIRW